jgi:hypothetical protein
MSHCGAIRERSVDASASGALSDGLGGRRMVSSCLPLTHPSCVARPYVVSESVIALKQNSQLRADDAERAADTRVRRPDLLGARERLLCPSVALSIACLSPTVMCTQAFARSRQLAE